MKNDSSVRVFPSGNIRANFSIHARFNANKNNNNNNSRQSMHFHSPYDFLMGGFRRSRAKSRAPNGVCPNQNRISGAASFARLSKSRACSVANRERGINETAFFESEPGAYMFATSPRCQRGRHAPVLDLKETRLSRIDSRWKLFLFFFFFF